jgi:hypothetical protein
MAKGSKLKAGSLSEGPLIDQVDAHEEALNFHFHSDPKVVVPGLD